MMGIFLYFFPMQKQDGNLTGLMIAFACLFFNTIGALLSRRINRGARMNAFIVSTVTIGIGGILMLLAGLVFYGLPAIQVEGTGMLLWLAVINTAVAFPLWNYSLQTLTAMESNIISNTMLIYVAILAYPDPRRAVDHAAGAGIGADCDRGDYGANPISESIFAGEPLKTNSAIIYQKHSSIFIRRLFHE